MWGWDCGGVKGGVGTPGVMRELVGECEGSKGRGSVGECRGWIVGSKGGVGTPGGMRELVREKRRNMYI